MGNIDMRGFLGIMVIAACMLAVSAPVSAENTLRLICKCQKVVVNGDEQRGCASQNDKVAIVDFDKNTLQWSDDIDQAWPALAAAITPDLISSGLDASKPRAIQGRLEISYYRINRITGEFEEGGMGHTTDPGAPNVDFIVPAELTGICTKADAPKF